MKIVPEKLVFYLGGILLLISAMVYSNLALWNVLEQLEISSGKFVIATLRTRELAIIGGTLGGFFLGGLLALLCILITSIWQAKQKLIETIFLTICLCSSGLGVSRVISIDNKVGASAVVSYDQNSSIAVFDEHTSDELLEFQATVIEEGGGATSYIVAFSKCKSQASLLAELGGYSIGLFYSRLVRK